VQDAALSATGQAVSATEGGSYTGVLATFSDANAGATVGDYTATIAWGDGSTGLGTVSAAAGGGWQVNGTHTYANEGAYTATVTLNDRGGSSATANGTGAVRDAALSAAGQPVSASEGNAYSGVLATFTDSNTGAPASDYTATVNWGDGTTSLGTIRARSGGGWQVSGTHTYADEGGYTAMVAVQDAGGSTATVSTTAAVTDAPLTGTAHAVSATEGASFNGVVASFTDANRGAATSDYNATITWGDGATGVGTVRATAGGGWQVTGSHTYAEEGAYTTSVIVQDRGGRSTDTTGIATVADAPLSASGLTIQATEGNAFAGVVATFSDTDPGRTVADYTATIAWGDGTVTTGTVVAAGRNGFSVRGAHTYAQPGVYQLTITTSDVGGSTATAVTTALIDDAPLTQTGQPNTVWTWVDTPVSVVVGEFRDRAPGAVAGQFTATIAWGDGSTGTGSVVQLPDGSFEVLGSHTYANPGPYAVQATVRDVTSTVTVSGELTVNVQTPASVPGPGMPEPSHPVPPDKVFVAPPPPPVAVPPTIVAQPSALAANTAPETIADAIDRVFEGGGVGMTEPVGKPGGQDPDAPADTTAAGQAECEALAAQAKTPDEAELNQAVDQIFAAGLSILASVGFILWNSQYGYLLFSALTARPLWKEFDPLAVINFWEKEAQKRKQHPNPLLDDDDDEEKQTLEPVFG
jgi:hypothetical protein